MFRTADNPESNWRFTQQRDHITRFHRIIRILRICGDNGGSRMVTWQLYALEVYVQNGISNLARRYSRYFELAPTNISRALYWKPIFTTRILFECQCSRNRIFSLVSLFNAIVAKDRFTDQFIFDYRPHISPIFLYTLYI